MEFYTYKGISAGKYIEGEIEALNQDDVDHKQFKIKREKLIKLTKKNKYILDNYGIWENLNLNSEKMRYIVSGNKGWLN